MSAYPLESTMQNGAYPWVAPSSLGQKSWPPGYQASLTDLFLKKNTLHFGTGISQLAAASSYIEKMSSFSDHVQKCPHPDAKDKPYPCEVCQQYFSIYNGLKSDGASSSSTNCGVGEISNVNRPMSAPPERKQIPPTQPPSPGLVNQNHLPQSDQTLQQPPPLSNKYQLPEMSHYPHRPRPPPTKQFMCHVCHKYFTQKGNLKAHMMIHTGEKPYACKVCGKSFTQKGNVDTHMKIHTGEREFGCDMCGKRFTQKGNLKTHIRSVHIKEKPFVCGVCGKCFSQKGNMQTHMRTHNKEDRFPCTLCGKTFSQKGNLKTHMQRHTGRVPSRQCVSRGCPTGPHHTPDSETAHFAPYRLLKSTNVMKIPSSSPPSSSPTNQPLEAHGQIFRNIHRLPPQVIKPIPETHPNMRTSPLQISSSYQDSRMSSSTPTSIGAHSHMGHKFSYVSHHPGVSSPSPPGIMNQPPAHLQKLSVHSFPPLQGEMIPSVMHSSAPHPYMSRINSPSACVTTGQVFVSENEERPFYSTPPMPVPAPIAHSSPWLSHGYQRHYNSFQPPSTMGSYGSINHHPTPLSRLALLSSSAITHHHPFGNSSIEDKHFGTNPAHDEHLESHYHQSGSPDFSQLLD
ncbi:gastrula zinc finger protein xFG20-1-like [Limulus polyphemus]|uniref:Gastrula zinc finger protein xFG20-1-like n=1 Tax=Limulus polyphemus TaxID=6850 RepID=A0ABM1TAH6_LIMPO|nr:gastrula zinc finger protein xFG20-1-like [Limulus polyphemus]XP_022252882.1 gastrula zinc finger protein xFG20-1-like [Limulus polyphemus]XP_022252883.1 gastrula zinc finger protein xFG20-1-like [Limulus polyphemus]